jgi:hypothetical protein
VKRQFLGFAAENRRAYITTEERSHHLHVIGSTGSGKSKFLEHLIRQDIRSGAGLCLIDPHGTLYHDVLMWCAYRRESRPIYLLDPSAGQRIVGFNPFPAAASPDADVSAQVERRIEATVKAWGVENSDDTPTLERVLRCLYHTIIEGGITLAEADYLLNYADAGVRHYLTRKVQTLVIRREWDELAAMSTAREFRDELRSSKNRLMRILASKTMLRFLAAAEPRLDFKEIMDSGAVVLVNLARSPIFSHTNARLMGAWLVNEIFETALQRKKNPRPFYLYLDEFQNFVSHDVASLLAEGRKFGLHAVLAHQTLAQVREESEKLYSGIMGLTRSKAVFGGLGRADAQEMVDHIFAGQVDVNEVKRVLYSTQFWPVYQRDKVFTKMHADTAARGSGAAESAIAAAGATSVPVGTDSFFFGQEFEVRSQFDNTGTVRATSEMEMEGSTDAESVADIPILMPERHEVVSDEKLFTLEEQLRKLGDQLMLQFTRHCFFKPMAAPCHPLLVPKVTTYELPEKSVAAYMDQLFERTRARTPAEVDAIFLERRRQIEAAAGADVPTPPPGRSRRRSSTAGLTFRPEKMS